MLHRALGGSLLATLCTCTLPLLVHADDNAKPTPPAVTPTLDLTLFRVPDPIGTRILSFLEPAATPTFRFATNASQAVAQTPAAPPAQGAAPTAQGATPAQTPPAAPAAPAGPVSRALPSPIDSPPFPITDWTVNNGFPIGESWDVPPGSLQRGLFGHKLDASGIRVVGWVDAGIMGSSSHASNLPLTYAFVPNRPELDQLILEIQRMPDTTQRKHIDWGFMSAHLFGIDYRFTAAQGWLSDSLLKHNNLYGYDPVLQWMCVYFPKIGQGAELMVGRFISPIDIEAQLSLQNYLFSHSLMFGVDPYTYTGMNMTIRVSSYVTILLGVHSGNENVFWSGVGNFNGEALIGWQSKDNKDSLWGGLDSIGDGKTRRNHDNEQIANFVWGHKFNDKWHMQSQAYYEFQYDPLKGGTPINGEGFPGYENVGPGPVIPGKAYAFGAVNYTEYKLSKNDYLTFRPGYLDDAQGWRTGYATHYMDITLGWAHWISANTIMRPEIGYQHSMDVAAFDNGTRKEQFTVGADIIYKF